MNQPTHSPLASRRAGILLHPTSLPGPFGNGDLGPEAFHFVEFLAASGQQVWQVLPLGPTHSDRSPYLALSTCAGNPDLISLHRLQEWGLLQGDITARYTELGRRALLLEAYGHFKRGDFSELNGEWQQFRSEQNCWLEEYSSYRVLKQFHHEQPWYEWPKPHRDREQSAMDEFRRQFAERLDEVAFEQFLFDRQWRQLKDYANSKGVSLFGDMPIFVAYDSADVWMQPSYFKFDSEGQPTVVAGVPPDYFSETGQLWGNPLYNWELMEAQGFEWWLRRIEILLTQFDLLRVDHFRGFEACWEVAAGEQTAINGQWVKVPGYALFDKLHQRFDPLPIVAEDLGTITPEVNALRDHYALPGMKILQFAFSGNADNPYLPHNHIENCVVYTGTHDNDTTMGWYQSLDDHTRHLTQEYLGRPQEEMPWALIRRAYSSNARLIIVPMQDYLELGSEARMNTPGVADGNWDWRYQWSELDAELAVRLQQLTERYQR